MTFNLEFYVLIIFQVLETVLSTYPHYDIDTNYAQNVTITEGNQAILPCHAQSNNLKVVWMNPKKIMISEKESRFMDDIRMSIERPFVGDYNLHIREVRYDDRGEYTCAVNTEPVQTKRIRLIVQVPSRFVNDGQRSEVIAVEGSTVRLTCNATGIPTPNITWFRQIPDSEVDQKEQIGTIGEVLVIHNISRYCGGVYECMAFNGVEPKISKSVKVDVQFKPEITIRNPRIGQELDKETILECIVTASPQGANFWKRGMEEIPSNDIRRYRVEIYPEGEFTVTISLRITSVEESDFGTYTCEANNGLGTATGDTTLYEFKKPTLPPTTTTLATTTRKFIYYPNFKTQYDNYEEKEGTKKETQISGQFGSGDYKGHAERVQSSLYVSMTISVMLSIQYIL